MIRRFGLLIVILAGFLLVLAEVQQIKEQIASGEFERQVLQQRGK